MSSVHHRRTIHHTTMIFKLRTVLTLALIFLDIQSDRHVNTNGISVFFLSIFQEPTRWLFKGTRLMAQWSIQHWECQQEWQPGQPCDPSFGCPCFFAEMTDITDRRAKPACHQDKGVGHLTSMCRTGFPIILALIKKLLLFFIMSI